MTLVFRCLFVFMLFPAWNGTAQSEPDLAALLDEAGKLPTDAQKAAQILYEEIAAAESRVAKLIPVDANVERSRDLVFSLLRDPSSEKAERLLETLSGEAFHFQFVRLLAEELKKNPDSLKRMERALEQLDSHIMRQSVPLQIPFQRALPLGLVLIALDDAFHSAYSTFGAYGFEIHYYIAASTAFLVALSKDLLFKVKVAPGLVREWINKREKRKAIQDMLSLVEHFKKHKAAVHNVRGLRYSIEEAVEHVPEILSEVLKIYETERDATKGSLTAAVRRILKERRVVKLIERLAVNQTPDEIRQLNELFKESSIPVEIKISENAEQMYRHLAETVEVWLRENQGANEADLLTAVANEQARQTHEARSRLGLPRLTEMSFLLIGIASQLAGHVASVGLEVTPVDTPVSEILRSGGVAMLHASQALLIAGLSFVTLNMATGWSPFGIGKDFARRKPQLPPSFFHTIKKIFKRNRDTRHNESEVWRGTKLSTNALGFVEHMTKTYGFGYYRTSKPKVKYKGFKTIFDEIGGWFQSKCTQLGLTESDG